MKKRRFINYNNGLEDDDIKLNLSYYLRDKDKRRRNYDKVLLSDYLSIRQMFKIYNVYNESVTISSFLSKFDITDSAFFGKIKPEIDKELSKWQIYNDHITKEIKRNNGNILQITKYMNYTIRNEFDTNGNIIKNWSSNHSKDNNSHCLRLYIYKNDKLIQTKEKFGNVTKCENTYIDGRIYLSVFSTGAILSYIRDNKGRITTRIFKDSNGNYSIDNYKYTETNKTSRETMYP